MAEPTQPAELARPRVELLWFQDCPNHSAARVLIKELLDELVPGTAVHEIDATDPAVAQQHRFPGSPTIRVDGRDVDPSYQDPGDYTPRCRLYRTADGLRGLPERAWVEAALQASLRSRAQARPRREGRGPRLRKLGSEGCAAGESPPALVQTVAIDPINEIAVRLRARSASGSWP